MCSFDFGLLWLHNYVNINNKNKNKNKYFKNKNIISNYEK